MEIKNTTQINERAFVKFQHFGMRIFKKHNFLNYLFWGCIAFFAFFISLISIILPYVSDKEIGFPYYSLFFLVTLTGLHYICYFILPKQMYKASPFFGGSELYVFTADGISCETVSKKHAGHIFVKYGDIKKVYERTGLFYVYFSNRHAALLVSKSGFETEAELCAAREKLKSAVPSRKYKVIK